MPKKPAAPRPLPVELPPLPASKRRGVKLLIVLSESESELIAKAAKVRGEPRASFIRTAALAVAQSLVQ